MMLIALKSKSGREVLIAEIRLSRGEPGLRSVF